MAGPLLRWLLRHEPEAVAHPARPGWPAAGAPPTAVVEPGAAEEAYRRFPDG